MGKESGCIAAVTIDATRRDQAMAARAEEGIMIEVAGINSEFLRVLYD
jgi:hypothetical protein